MAGRPGRFAAGTQLRVKRVVIIGTTVWVDYLRGAQNDHVLWLHEEMARRRLGLTDIILCEVLQGVFDDAAFERVRNELMQYQIFETVGTMLAVESARNFQRLRRRGCTVRKTVDCLIATFCIQESHSLLHRYRDFDPFETHLGLSVIHP